MFRTSTRKPWHLAGLMLAWSFMSCSGVEESPGAQRVAALEQTADLCAEWAAAACNDTVIRRCAARDTEACTAAQQAYCERLMPAMQYDPADASACLEAVSNAYSDAELTSGERDLVQDLAAPCASLFSGEKQEGESCSRDNECNAEGGLSCIVRPGDSLGTCELAEVMAGGFACTESYQECDDGFYCNGEHCVAKRDTGDDCSAKDPCADELKCVLDADEGQCRSKFGTGEGCREDDDCQSDICIRTPGAERGLCAAAIVLSPSDALCDSLR